MSQNIATDAPQVQQMTGRQKAWLIFLVVMKRVRFLAILAGIGFFLVYWDAIKLHWDRWMHPRTAAVKTLPDGREFFCPMDPQVKQDTYQPNGDVPDCPICGMPLVIRNKGQKEELPPGVTGLVNLSRDQIAMAGIKTATIGYQPMSKRIKTVGYVTYDESGLSRIVSRVDGYVEKLYADKSYAMVRAGDPLAEIYSPELYSTAKELILAKKSNVSPDLMESARQKLALLGVSKEEIAAIEDFRQPPARLVIRSPRSGHVIDKRIVAGASVEAKMTLFEVADLSTVWIEAEIYESDVPFVHVGQEIAAAVESYPNRTFQGKIALVHPHLEEATRTNRVRIRFDNPNHELRPGMFAEVTIDTPLETIEPYKKLAVYPPLPPGEGQGVRAAPGANAPASINVPSPKPSPKGRGGLFLAVPESAVIDTGAKKIVYVERGEGQFEGHEVELGPRQDEFFPVVKGLSAGDRVAAAGSFLVDAETRLNPAAAAVYFGASGGGQSGGSMPEPSAHKTSPDKAAEHRREPSVFLTEDELKNIDELPEEDRRPAKAQAICPVQGVHLGSMGVPIRITLRGTTVFVCCKGCAGKAKRDPGATLKKLEEK